MSDALRILYSESPGIAAQQARDARARAWAYVFSCYLAKQEAVGRATKVDTKLVLTEGGRT